MLGMMKTSLNYCAFKVDGFFKRVFKEQAGGAEVVAAIIIVGIVLVLALAFRTSLNNLVNNLWKTVVQSKDADAVPTIADFGNGN